MDKKKSREILCSSRKEEVLNLTRDDEDVWYYTLAIKDVEERWINLYDVDNNLRRMTKKEEEEEEGGAAVPVTWSST